MKNSEEKRVNSVGKRCHRPGHGKLRQCVVCVELRESQRKGLN